MKGGRGGEAAEPRRAFASAEVGRLVNVSLPGVAEVSINDVCAVHISHEHLRDTTSCCVLYDNI